MGEIVYTPQGVIYKCKNARLQFLADKFILLGGQEALKMTFEFYCFYKHLEIDKTFRDVKQVSHFS